MPADSGVTAESAPECWAAPSGFESGSGWSYHTGLWSSRGELVLTVRTSLSMNSFDARDLHLHAWVESADGQRRRHFRGHAMTGGLNDFVSV
jgi:hypothetical protein